MSVGLLIIDIQNDYFPGAKWELVGSEQAGQLAGGLLKFFREHSHDCGRNHEGTATNLAAD